MSTTDPQYTRRALIGSTAAGLAAATVPAQSLASPHGSSGRVRLADAALIDLPTDAVVDGPPSIAVDERRRTVTVSGVTSVPTPCHEPTLAAASYDEDTGSLELALGAEDTSDPDRGCIQVVDRRAYGIRARFRGGLPESVSVAQWGEQPAEAAVADLPTSTVVVGETVETTAADRPADCTPRLTGSRSAQLLRVRGVTTLGSPCSRFRVDRSEYLPEHDAVVVELSGYQPDDETCIQATTDLGYDLSLRCNGGLPGRFVVREGDEASYVYDLRR